MSIELTVTPNDVPRITFEEARKRIAEMNLINGFLLDSIAEDDEKGRIVVKCIVDSVLDMDIPISKVKSQKVINGLDSIYHGIRLDVSIEKEKALLGNTTIYDLEVEDRAADKKELPKRGRYYQALTDSVNLPTSASYMDLPDYVSITILSYDPFDSGDMYYEVKSVVESHPDIKYEDGIRRIFLYGKGKNNLKGTSAYRERVEEVVNYIVTGEKKENPDPVVTTMDKIVSDTKGKTEVTKKFMQNWDRIEHIKRDITKEVTEKVTKEVTKEAVLGFIEYGRALNDTDENIRSLIKAKFKLDDETIDELFSEASV